MDEGWLWGDGVWWWEKLLPVGLLLALYLLEMYHSVMSGELIFTFSQPRFRGGKELF